MSVEYLKHFQNIHTWIRCKINCFVSTKMAKNNYK